MKRSEIFPLPEFFDKYIKLVWDVCLTEAFEKSFVAIKETDIDKLEKIGFKSYFSGKWTINEIFQPLTDGERMLCYRASLRLAFHITSYFFIDI